ncbi:hypothetical protein GCM10011609_78200 [Lentzea pudingi]|uniref:Uncharacterized protein n=1 Tax=Lentzea pudingi TaxID=1789439 RepID=A0ABQ2IQJ7_9PSEU|nr:hypothetical protein [Lentzea pudingi]GGN24550.1 hypothetical protein GCM10011609_78200 [Lentzea pudingi]
MSAQEVRQLGVVLVAAGPGLALAAFVAGMTLPLYDFLRVLLAGEGVLAALGCAAVGVAVIKVPDLSRLVKVLRFGSIVPFVTGFIALETLYTDFPEADGLLTSLSSVVFTVAVVASTGAVMFVVAQVDRNTRGSGLPETFIPGS